MKMCPLVLAAVLSFTGVARGQDFPTDPYEFITAKLAAAEGRHEEAITLMNAVIAKNPDNPVLLYERAMMYLDAGRVDRAEAELRAVTASHPDLYDAQRVLGRLLLDRSGSDRAKTEEALRHLQAAFKLNPDDLSTGVAVSQLLLASGKTGEAERILAALVERAPDQRTLNYSYAQILTKLGRSDEARPYLEKVVLLDPTFGPAVIQLLEIYQAENEWEKAAQVVQPLVDEDPLNMEIRKQQAYLWLRAGRSDKALEGFEQIVKADPGDNRSRFHMAEALGDANRFAEAETIYRQLMKATPDDVDLLASFGLNLASQEKWAEAKEIFTKLLRQQGLPDNLAALARTQLAHGDLEQGNFDAAIETAKPVFVFRDKPNTQAINIALEALKRQKKYREGVALLEPMVTQFANDPFINSRYVEMLVRAGDVAKAKEVGNAQAKLGNRGTIAMAEAFVLAGDTASAIAVIKEGLKARPDEVELQFQLGSVYERAEDRSAAEKQFLSILEKHPDHAGSLNYLGYMYAESGTNLKKAEEMLTRALAQEPENGAYLDSLGWIYFRQGNLPMAEKYLSEAARLMPRDATVQEHLGDVYAKQGNSVRALQLYRRALTLEPDDESKLQTKITELERKSPTSPR